MKKNLSSAILAAAVIVPLVAAAGSADLWPGTQAGAPAPSMSGVPTALRNELANFDDLDFRVYSTQQWQDVHRSHSDDVIVHWPDGHQTQGLAQHIQDMKWMFYFAPDTRITMHPVRFGTNDAEWTAVTSFLDGTFTLPMPTFLGTLIQPTNRTFHLSMVTLGHWNAAGLMDEEYLFWDNAALCNQLGIDPSLLGITP
jgi:hypothetical protein